MNIDGGMKKGIDSAMDKCEQLAELIRIIKDGGENAPRLLYDLAAEKCNEISQLLTGRNTGYFGEKGNDAGQVEVNTDDNEAEADTPGEMTAAGTVIEITTPAAEGTDDSVSAETTETTPDNPDFCEENSIIGYADAVDEVKEEGSEVKVTADEVKTNDLEAKDTTDDEKNGEQDNGVSGTLEEVEVPTGEEESTEDEEEKSDFSDSGRNNDAESSDSDRNTGTESDNEEEETLSPNVEASTPSHGISFERRCKIKGIREVLSINDLYLFKRELFNNDVKEMNSLFDKLEKADTLDECESILNGYINFEPGEESPAAEFFERLKNRF